MVQYSHAISSPSCTKFWSHWLCQPPLIRSPDHFVAAGKQQFWSLGKKNGHLRQESSHFCTHKWLGVVLKITNASKSWPIPSRAAAAASTHLLSRATLLLLSSYGVQSPWETLVLEWLTVKNGIVYKQVIPKSIGLSVFSLLNLLFGSIRPFSSIFRHPQITLKVKVLNVMLAVMFLQLGCSYPPTVLEDKILNEPSIMLHSLVESQQL